MIEHRTQLQAQAAMGRQQGIARDLRSHLAGIISGHRVFAEFWLTIPHV
jgi:hypothetical protein